MIKLLNITPIILLLLVLSCNPLADRGLEQTYIVITFDDQDISIYEEAFPVMKEYSYPGVNAVNSGFIGRENCLNWKQLIEMEFVYGWETAGHTLTHANLPDCSEEEVIRQIQLDWEIIRAKGLKNETFVLPRGHARQSDIDIIKKYYSNIRNSQDSRMFTPLDRLNLGYFPYISEYRAEDAIKRIKEGVLNRESLIILGFHRFNDSSYSHNCKTEDFKKILAFINETGLEVVTIKEAVSLIATR